MAAETAGLSPEEVEIFARGLYHLASVDGIAEREADLIAEFLRDTSSTLTLEDLKGTSFNPIEAAQALEASYLRRIFVKAAIALVKADGIFSDAERRALGEIADVFGLSNADFGDLEQQATRELIV
ncbi:MAG: TerB family tellurite resistance protein [Myxococcales bacterium]|nr:TerB family tellurite resistance protein [Myxococcales bacterium]MCB9705100.1 TerB family tellurite resistance protein [Myxococcales bacterium]